MLNADDLRYARATDLQELTGIHASNFAAWTHKRHISEKNLKVIADALGMPKHEVLRGFEMRRKDEVAAREVQAKLEKLITPEAGVA